MSAARCLAAGLLGASCLTALLAACQTPAGQPGPSGPATPGPRATASTSVSAADLTGTWVFGSRGEPGPGPVVTCAPDQVMALAQEGQRVLGSVSTRTGLVRQIEEFEGQNVAGEVALAGTYRGNLAGEASEVTYALSFDPASRHLRGKRLGESFWAAPWVDPGTPVCGARPPASPGPVR